MKQNEKQRPRSLTLLFSLFTFAILAVSLLLAVGIIYVLTWFGLLEFSGVGISGTLQLLLLMAAISLIVGTGLAVLAAGSSVSPSTI